MIHKEEDHMDIHTSMLEDMDKRKVVEDRDGSWTRGYGYPRVSYPMDMDTSRKIHPRVLSGWIPEMYRVGYE
jgi:hypothetical protein